MIKKGAHGCPFFFANNYQNYPYEREISTSMRDILQMKKQLLVFLLVSSLGFSSCQLLPVKEDSLSSDDIVNGLKTALEVGTDSSVFYTSAVDGYMKDQAIKIFLPKEAEIIVNNIGKVPGGQNLLDNVILLINRSAEDAAKSAGPILKNSITSLSISEGLSILNGKNPVTKQKSASDFDSTAATNYLIGTTYDDLVTAFSIPINQSLNKPLLGSLSTNKAWSDLTNAYNNVVDLDVFNLLGLQKVNVSLSQHVTQKALDGLFLKVGEQEVHIRRNPWKWVTDAVGDILTKVFGK